MNQVVVGTAGHIDHGKTALVKALTGVNTDKLSEEQERGMTIDLGFAYLNDRVTIIDVPGHERFIRNMVAGVSTIDFVLLVIALDDGIMPQTMEHLNIISLLGIPDGIVVLTKVDLVTDKQWVELVKEEIQEKVKGTVLEGKPMVKTSIQSNEGIRDIYDLISSLEKKEKIEQSNDYFRLQVDRAFHKTGYGLIVTGTVLSGETSVGASIAVEPSNKTGKVRGLQSHGKTVDSVIKGDRAAINLSGLELNQVWRGSELITPKSNYSTQRVIAEVTLIEQTKWKIKSQQRLRIHLGTSETLAKVEYIPKTISSGDTINTVIKFDSPVTTSLDDRFIIRAYSPMDTIGGGIILDKNPKGIWKIIKQNCKKLSTDIEMRLIQFIQFEIERPKSIQFWSNKFSKSKKYIENLVKNSDLIFEKQDMIISNEGIFDCKKEVMLSLKTFHDKNPYRSVVNSESIRNELNYSRKWFDYLISELDGKELNVQKGGLALKSHKVELQDKDKKIIEKIKTYVKKNSLHPFTVIELCENINGEYEQILELLHIMKRSGDLLDISNQIWMTKLDWDSMLKLLYEYYELNDILSIGKFKLMTNLTRKTAIPVLEYLDKIGITIRKGNDRFKGTKFPSNYKQV